ncbi:MAG: 30S ribosomal protein S6 [Candidatus Harrisonbacteria bacterium]|nr:30S ribosomal protein S6 [Candidatus Harrisonbacteria bacterium]
MELKHDKKEYELSFLLKSRDSLNTLETAFVQSEAEVLYTGSVVETRLAYPIKKYNQALFGYFHFRALPENAEKLAKILNLNSALLRFLIVTPPITKNVGRQRGLAESSKLRPRPADATAAVDSSKSSGALTNEALEEKLEEILK